MNTYPSIYLDKQVLHKMQYFQVTQYESNLIRNTNLKWI